MGINRKTLRNLNYLKRVESREKMPRSIIDPLGMPVGGNNQPQRPMIDPILHLFWPIYGQTLHDLTAKPESNHTAKQLVDFAWEVANRSFNKMGFAYVPPLHFEILPDSSATAELAEKT